jgi:hypothetical protein
VALLLGRGEATAVWVVLPLAAWLLAATRPHTSAFAAAIQVAVIVGVAIAASGHIGVGPLSFWDAAVAFAVMAIVGCVAAWYATERTDMNGRHPRPTALRLRLARIERFALPVAMVLAGCLGGVVALPVTPPTPPPGIVYPLPDQVRADEVDLLCGPGPTVTCTWSIEVEADPYADTSTDGLIALLENHLFPARGWSRATPRCRSWGWTVQERVCVTLHVRATIVTLSGPAPWPAVNRHDAVRIVVTYG